MRNTIAVLLLGIGPLFLAAACATSGRVTRIAAGRQIEGRFIEDEAYAEYANGVVLETQGKLDAARGAYEEALRHDPASPELWTRLGALRCRQSAGAADPDPWEAFTRAAEIDASYEEAWTERARCHLQRGELPSAVSDAERAVSLDPNRMEPVFVLVTALERQGRLADAKRWLTGLIARNPGSIEVHEAALAFASRASDPALGEASRRALDELRSGERRRDAPSRAEVDLALTRGEFEGARKLAVRARISSGSLALRAAALGKSAFAGDQAALVMAADPSDVDARVAAVVAADLARDDAALGRALSDLPESFTPLSPLAALLLGEVLQRRIGEEAAHAVTRAAGATEIDDPLVKTVAGRK